MSVFKIIKVVLLMILCLSIAAQTLPAAEKKESAYEYRSNPLRGKHSISLSAGILGGVTVENEVSAHGEITSVVGSEFLGSVAYTYWLEDDLAVNFSVGLLSLDVTNSVQGVEESTETATVVPLLFGVKYQPFKLTASDVLRPYIAASIGPFFGTETMNRTGVNIETETYTETALGSRLGVGVDLLPGRHFALGLGAGYYFVSDFERPVGSEKNHSNPELSLSFGVVF